MEHPVLERRIQHDGRGILRARKRSAARDLLGGRRAQLELHDGVQRVLLRDRQPQPDARGGLLQANPAALEQGGPQHPGPDGRQLKPRAVPLEDVQVDGLAAVGGAAPLTVAEGSAPGRVDALAVAAQPLSHFPQPLHLPGFQFARRHRSQVQQQVAVPGDGIDQVADGLLPAVHPPARAIGPLPPHQRHARFPRPPMLEGAHALLRRVEIALQVERRLAAGADGREPVVHQNLRLQAPDHGEQVVHPPVLQQVAAAETVEPDDVNLAVVGEQFANLIVQELGVFGVVALQVIRVIPVALRVVHAEPHPSAVAGVREFLHHVTAEGRAADLVIRVRRAEHREPVVVLGHQHDVLHARVPGDPHPFLRVEPDWVELLVERVVGLDGDLLERHNVARPRTFSRPAQLFAGEATRAPVQEQAKLGLAKPGEPLLAGFRVRRECRRQPGNQQQRRRRVSGPHAISLAVNGSATMVHHDLLLIESARLPDQRDGGRSRVRTADLLLARQGRTHNPQLSTRHNRCARFSVLVVSKSLRHPARAPLAA